MLRDSDSRLNKVSGGSLSLFLIVRQGMGVHSEPGHGIPHTVITRSGAAEGRSAKSIMLGCTTVVPLFNEYS